MRVSRGFDGDRCRTSWLLRCARLRLDAMLHLTPLRQLSASRDSLGFGGVATGRAGRSIGLVLPPPVRMGAGDHGAFVRHQSSLRLHPAAFPRVYSANPGRHRLRQRGRSVADSLAARPRLPRNCRQERGGRDFSNSKRASLRLRFAQRHRPRDAAYRASSMASKTRRAAPSLPWSRFPLATKHVCPATVRGETPPARLDGALTASQEQHRSAFRAIRRSNLGQPETWQFLGSALPGPPR
jgi:hypothetical protein